MSAFIFFASQQESDKKEFTPCQSLPKPSVCKRLVKRIQIECLKEVERRNAISECREFGKYFQGYECIKNMCGRSGIKKFENTSEVYTASLATISVGFQWRACNNFRSFIKDFAES